MDMTLDDIIKTKKAPKSTKPNGKIMKRKSQINNNRALSRKNMSHDATVKVDARLKIIQKNRAKISDARDKLAELTRAGGDARKKLVQKQQLQMNSNLKLRNNRHNSRNLEYSTSRRPNVLPSHKIITNDFVYRNTARPIHTPSIPRGYVDFDNMKDMEEEELESATRLSRTVKNDMVYNNKVKHSTYNMQSTDAARNLKSWAPASEYDPFDVYEVQIDSRLERKISPLHDMRPPPMPKGILRSSSRHQYSDKALDYHQRRFIGENPSHLSYKMRSRLEHAPDPHASMGIFSNPMKGASDSDSSTSGYRIVVSNLHTNVSQLDIKELFEDIGELYDSRIVRPGVAEVIYKKLSDAENAVDTYHNRQLDGLPMKCLLVNPRASNKPTAPAIRSSSSNVGNPSGSKTPLEIDIDALHKVLFRRH